MKNNFLFMTIKAMTEFIKGLLNKLITIIYLMLPIGLFLLVMQLRSKNNKATAIGTFTEPDGEFQFIFPNYILVANYPNSMKSYWKKKFKNTNKFLEKWKWLFIVGILSVVGILIILKLFVLS